MKAVFRNFRTKPLIYVFFLLLTACFVLCSLSADTENRNKGTLEVRNLAGEAYAEPWNGEEDFVFRTEDERGNTVRILVKGAYLYDRSREEILKAGICVAKNLKATRPEVSGNFGQFDYCKYLRSHGIDAYVYAAEGSLFVPEGLENGVFRARYVKSDGTVMTVEHGLKYYSAALRRKIGGVLNRYFGRGFSALILSVMTGDTGALDREARDNLSRAGFSHLIAVSGAHVGFVTVPFSVALKRFVYGSGKRKLILLLPVGFLWFVAGGSCSVTRAAVCCALSAVCTALRKNYDSCNALGFVGVLQLAVRPFSVFSTGFLLSYGAALSLAVVLPALKKRLEIKNKRGGALLPALAVNLGILPVQLYLFRSFSLCGILLSVLAAQIAGALCVGGYFVVCLDRLFSLRLFRPMTGALTGLTYALEWIAEKISGGRSVFFRMETPAPGIVFFVVWYSLLAWLVIGKKGRILGPAAVLVLAAALVSHGMTKTEVLFFDVGQGSAALVRTRDGVNGLIDTGTGLSADLGELLKREGVRKLDFLVLSHGHSDHVNGLVDVLAYYTPKTVFVPDNSLDSYCCSLADNYGLQVVKIDGKETFSLGKDSVMEAFESTVDTDNLNDGSLAVRISGKWGSILFPGEAEEQELTEFLDRGLILPSTVLVLAHHGSKTSGNEKFLCEAAPKYVMISVGYGNSYGHPSKLVLEDLKKQGISEKQIFRTDRDGAVRVHFGVDLFGREFTLLWRKKLRTI